MPYSTPTRWRLGAEIRAHEALGGKYRRLVLKAAQIAACAKPGQFVNVYCSEGWAPFWRRPFSLCGAADGCIEFVYAVLGAGTQHLAQRSVGDEVDLIGPLGKGFELDRASPGEAVYVGGGYGVTPFLWLLNLPEGRHGHLIHGARSRDDLLFLAPQHASVTYTTEDGSYGETGLVTEALRKRLASCRAPMPMVLACGPRAMLRAVAAVAQEFGAPCQVALEELMACGVGGCAGCAIKVGGTYKLVCRDGPVFDAQEVDWHDPA